MLSDMKLRSLHSWSVTPARGRELQEELAKNVEMKPVPPEARLVAGADMAFSKAHGVFFASVLVFGFPGLELLEEVSVQHKPTFPYVPGLLTFREGPVLMKAIRKLRIVPDVFIFDGQGVAHPRRLGLAAHLGLWLGIPTVGCAKSRLIGTYDPPGHKKGSRKALFDKQERIGTVLRTRDGVKPVFISPGHLADFQTSTRLVLQCCTKYRLPEPTRLADKAVARVKKEFLETV